MRTRSLRSPGALALAGAIALAGCGKTGGVSQPAGRAGPAARVAPLATPGAVAVRTRNTTRLGGANAITDAAAVARVAYPGLTRATRPTAVVLVNSADWSAALAAAALASAPLRAPLLYSEGSSLPALSAETLEAMHPLGSRPLRGAQVIRIASSAPVPGGYGVRSLPAGEPAGTAAAIEQVLRSANGGRAARQVIVLAANADRALLMPAAGLAAESGAPILFVNRARVPLATASVLTQLHRPKIYVIDSAAVGARTMRTLARYGTVTTITAGDAERAVDGAIAVARFTDGTFGWGVKEPGHGLVFATVERPLDAPAAALLSATGDYAPLLLLEGTGRVPPALSAYLGDIQPGYTGAPRFRPVRGVYNHGWLIGDERAISALTQARIDAMLEISLRAPSSEEPVVAPAE